MAGWKSNKHQHNALVCDYVLLALTTSNGAPANPPVVHQALLECGMGVTANQVLTVIKKIKTFINQ